MQNHKVSIIVLSWNTKQLLGQCLRSLMSELEIIVVDNGSRDGSPEMVRKEFPGVKLIRNKKNLGFAKGNNQGAQAAAGDLVMFLNSDTIVQNKAIEKLANTLSEMDNKVAAISPLLTNEDGSIQKDPCYLKFPSLLTTLFYYNKILKRLIVKFFPRIFFSATNFERLTEVDQLPGAAMMVRKEVFNKLGGFDESYPLYFEDVDLCFRMKKLGYKLMLEPKAEIIHLGRKSIEPVVKREGVEKFYFLNFKSLFLFCEKNYSRFKALLIKKIVFLHLLLTFKFDLIKALVAR